MTVKEKTAIAIWLINEGAKLEANPPEGITPRDACRLVGSLLYVLHETETLGET